MAWIPIILLNLIVLFNAVLHNPSASYDSTDHRLYAQTLATGRLPNASDTREFFSAPLAYVPSAILQHFGVKTTRADKVWQYLNVLYSFGLSLYLVRIFHLLYPSAGAWVGLPVWLLGMFPVIYRTFAMPRSEPLVALLGSAALYISLQILIEKEPPLKHYALLGFLSGLLILARQWGFFLLPGLFLPLALRLWCERKTPAKIIGRISVAYLLLGLVGGWFYLHLQLTQGSITAFNREKNVVSIIQVADELGSINQLPATFVNPIRPALGELFLPILYADTWGDYWSYFLIVGYKASDGRLVRMSKFNSSDKRGEGVEILSNEATMGKYLGRVNIVSLLPSLALVLALTWTSWTTLQAIFRHKKEASLAPPLLIPLVMLAVTLLGYLWFQIHYSSEKGNTIKATYLIQIFPLLALLGASAGLALRQRSRSLFNGVIGLLLLAMLHTSPTFLTRVDEHMVDRKTFLPAFPLD